MVFILKYIVLAIIFMAECPFYGTILQQTARPGSIRLINENGYPIIGSFLTNLNTQDLPLFQQERRLSNLEKKVQSKIDKDHHDFLDQKKSEVRQLQTETHMLSSRRFSPGLEQLIGHVFPVLDHGSITVIDYMGTDEAIALAAWISTGKSQYTQDDIRKLITHMTKEGHTSPFEMAVIQLKIKLPIFIARQWFRHRMASYNEKSARYSELGNAFYIPDINRLKQGLTPKAKELDDQKLTEKIQELMNYEVQEAYERYDRLMHELFLNQELARTLLPVSVYTEFYWRIDLHNLFHFLELRTSPHAQYEIQQYANIILHQIVQPWVPAAYDAFMKYRYNAAMVPEKYMKLVHICLKEGKIINQEESGLNDEEYKEFLKFFKINGKVA